ncbi:MAG: PilZ domain-containing protein [Candidatus Ratteibacteria bacterium]|nr:PilZ domain-containing protein [Candidatus Ratteibacteria bacterium]
MKKYYTVNKNSKMSKSFQGPDRRRYPRFDFPFFIRYKKSEEISKTSTGEGNILFVEKGQDISIARDVSIGGICFAVKEPLPPRAKLTVEIFTPIKSAPFTAFAEVVWQKKRALSSTYLTGVSFLQLDDDKEFTHLLNMLTELKLEKMIEK